LNPSKKSMDSPIASTITVVGKKDILLQKLLSYYTPEKKQRMKEIVSGGTKLSLRIIDWFVTNYSRSTITVYKLPSGVSLNVYNDYKNQLRAFSKKLFDPFCRRERIEIAGLGVTTIGQMNFFKWAMENGVIEHTLKHVREIEKNMVHTQNKGRLSSTLPTKRRSVAKTSPCIVREDCCTTIRFN